MLITIPIIHKVSTNKIYSNTLHWSQRKQIAQDYHMLVLAECRKHKIELPVPAHLQFVFYFKGKLLDVSNCSFMAKMLEDGLVHAGVLQDDTQKYVNKITLEVEKAKEDYITIKAE